MSRCSNLYQARANASASWSGFSKNRFEISLYTGSVIKAMSVVAIIGAWRLDGS